MLNILLHNEFLLTVKTLPILNILMIIRTVKKYFTLTQVGSR